MVKIRLVSHIQEYISLLQFFYTYFGALEDLIDQYIGTDRLPDYPERRKTKLLLHDIQLLGGIAREKVSGKDLPKIKNNLQAFGALYVIEGSTLGGKIIGKIMAKQLRKDDEDGLSFFSGYRDQTENRWIAFKAILDTQTQNEEEEMLVLQAADETFYKFRLWLGKSESIN